MRRKLKLVEDRNPVKVSKIDRIEDIEPDLEGLKNCHHQIESISRIREPELELKKPDFNPYSANHEIYCKDTGERCTGDKYLESKHWKRKRRDLYCYRDGICQKCHKYMMFGLSRVHHVNYDRMGNERLKDLMLLCGRCHSEIHGYEFDPFERRRWILEKRMKAQASKSEIDIEVAEGYDDLLLSDDEETYIQENTDDVKELPTQKQVDYATTIAQTLEIDLPEENSKEAYTDFISTFVNDYKRKKYEGGSFLNRPDNLK